MAAATPGGVDGAGGYGDLPGLGPDDHLGLDDVDGSSSYYSSADDEDLEEEAALSMEDRVKLAEIWVAHPTSPVAINGPVELLAACGKSFSSLLLLLSVYSKTGG